MRTHQPLAVAFIWLLACGDSDGTAGGGMAGQNQGGEGGAATGGAGAGGEAGQAQGGAGGSGGSAPIGGRVFASSATYDGVLGGISGADDRCQALADAAGLGGTFRAWIGDTQGNGPLTNFTRSTVPYTLIGGDVIAQDFDDLVDGALAGPITRDENGALIGAAMTFAWTGTMANGMAGSPCCTDWSSTEAGGWVGSIIATDDTWSFVGGSPCTGVARLYCFEQ